MPEARQHIAGPPKGAIDETGHRYGRLVVLAYDEAASRDIRHAMWRCRCDCGAEPTARGSKLRAGRIVSCGCWRADPGVRQAARMKVSARRRKAISRQGATARWRRDTTPHSPPHP